MDGDSYSVPPGVPNAYATIALRAAGRGAEKVRWYVDDAPWPRERWPLAPGAHVVTARSVRGESRVARITVEGR